LKFRGALTVVVLCLVSAAAGFGAYRWWQARGPQAEAVELRPDLQFFDLDGTPHRLSEWNGKLLLLNFWATWCAPCIAEIPLLVDAQRKYGARGLQVVGIAMDETQPVRDFATRMKMNYPIMIGGPEITDAMDRLGDELGALPFSVLIAPDGRIVARTSGALQRDDITGWVKQLPP
jgi:thiol-disulfide isomerase/thioredoxin